MPHPTWDETQPQGTAPSNTIDEIIRQLKAEIRERMNDFVVDWTTDPVVLQPIPAATLPLGGATIFPPHLIFTGGGLGTISGVTPAFVAVTGDAIFPIPISEDLGTMHISTVSFVINPTGTAVNWSLAGVDYPNTSSTVLKSGSQGGSADVVVTAWNRATDGELIINGVKRLTIGFDSPGSLWNLFGVKVTYEFTYS